MLAEDFGGDVDDAETFIAEEEIDSGVISSSGRNVRFWHLTFQEYLSARAIAGQSETQQLETFTKDRRLYQPEWRETALLFAGVLYEQSKQKLDAFVSALLGTLGDGAELPEEARCVGLLGAMVRELRPYSYEPCDQAYRKTLDAAMAIFDPVEGQKIDLSTRIDAADALALAGDPRLAVPEESWVRIPEGKFLSGAQAESSEKANYEKKSFGGPIRAASELESKSSSSPRSWSAWMTSTAA